MKNLLILGFEPPISDVRNDRSAYSATTTPTFFGELYNIFYGITFVEVWLHFRFRFLAALLVSWGGVRGPEVLGPIYRFLPGLHYFSCMTWVGFLFLLSGMLRNAISSCLVPFLPT